MYVDMAPAAVEFFGSQYWHDLSPKIQQFLVATLERLILIYQGL